MKQKLIRWLLKQLRAPMYYVVKEERYKVELLRSVRIFKKDYPRTQQERELIRDMIQLLHESGYIEFNVLEWYDGPEGPTFPDQEVRLEARVRFVIPKRL